MEGALPNAPTPNRAGDLVDATSTEKARTSRDIEEPITEITLTNFGLLSWGTRPPDRTLTRGTPTMQ